MKTYPKIETLYDRDEDFKVIVGKHRRPEFKEISRWIVTEKIDGTNIRLHADRVEDDLTWTISGKTDNAQIPPKLLAVLQEWTKASTDKVGTIMVEHDLSAMTLFGEGYGPKIQNGGYYREDQGFILFDVQVDDGPFLADLAMRETAFQLGLDAVPYLGVQSEEAIVDMVVANFYSFIAVDDRAAEGVVCKPAVPLYDNRGERVMWKLKGRDFARPRT